MVIASKKEIEKRFAEYNALYFENKLPPCPIKPLIGQGLLAYGEYFSKRRGGPMIRININRQLRWTEEDFKETIIHEMLHYYIDLKYGWWLFSHHLPPFSYEVWKFKRKYGIDLNRKYIVPTKTYGRKT